jgi:ribulose kinase
VNTLAARYRAMLKLGVDERSVLVASGNALRRNALLRKLAGEAFGMRVVLPPHAEEAAYGAALVGAVASGALADLAEASQFVHEIERE